MEETLEMLEQIPNRRYKDTVFRMVFKEKKELLSLFNAINGTNYSNPEELEINTLENAIYMSFKNDISCVLDMRMNLFEHQSSVNPNMPLRDLFYVSRLYEKMVVGKDIYSRKRIKLPTPKFVVLYNGEEEQPERKIMHLSDSYSVDTGEINLELTVLQININKGCNQELVDCCQTLSGNIQFTDRVRKYQKEMTLPEAVERAVAECINEGILADFLRANRAEVISMSIFEYDEELHKRTLREEGMEEGMEKGRENAITEIIKNMLDKHQSPEFISNMVSCPIEYVYKVKDDMELVVCEDSRYEV